MKNKNGNGGDKKHPRNKVENEDRWEDQNRKNSSSDTPDETFPKRSEKDPTMIMDEYPRRDRGTNNNSRQQKDKGENYEE